MQWEDDAIVMQATRFGERDTRASVFTQHYGRYHAIVKGGGSKQSRADWQTGNVLRVHWNARLAEQMGTMRAELLRPYASLVLHSPLALAALTSVCALCERVLQERDPHPQLYVALHTLLEVLSETNDKETWLAVVVQVEMVLLREAGYGLDLSCCAATGQAQNLIYVSPKSGRAVSADAGYVWREKLLPLPAFVLDVSSPAPTLLQVMQGLELTGYFLYHWIFYPMGYELPAARSRMLAMIPQ
jgi:DNA repair protein RecO (recombination protein O)